MLTQNGADLINKNRKIAYEGKSTYAQQYCADPSIKHRQANMIQLLNKSKQTYTRIAVGQFGGRFERGVRVDQEYKITDLSVTVLTRPVDLEYMNSFPEEELCPPTIQENTESVDEPQQSVASPIAQPIWQSFQSSGAGIKASFPTEAEETQTSGQGGTQYTLTAKSASGVYQISALPLPQKYNDQQKNQIIDGMAANFIKANQATKRMEKTWTHQGFPGKVYDMVRPQSGVVKYRIFASDEFLYQIILSTTQSTWNAEDEQQFFDSVELIK